MLQRLISCLAVCLCLCSSIKAQAFVLDTTFSTNYPFYTGEIAGFLEQDDGYFMLYGDISDLSLTYPQMFVRFDANANVDFNFVVSPNVLFPGRYAIETSYGYFIAAYFEFLKVDQWGHIYDSVFYNNTHNLNNPANPGMVMHGPFPYVFPDGRLIAGSNYKVDWPSHTNPLFSYYLFRMNADGWYDSTFVHDLNGGVHSVIQYNDSLLMVFGGFTQYDSFATQYIARIDLDGNIDTTFKSIVTIGDVGIVHVQPDGRMFATGYFMIQGSADTFGLVRLKPDGSLDSTFNNTAIINRRTSSVIAVCPVPGSGFLLGGALTEYDGVSRGNIVKINENGYIDTTYFKGSGFDSTMNPSLGIPPRVYRIVHGQNDMYYVCGYFNRYNHRVVQPVTRFKGLTYAIEESRKSEIRLQVYPNPSEGKITIAMPPQLDIKNCSLLIYNILGGLIENIPFTGRLVTLNLKGLDKGVFIIAFESEGAVLFKEKVIID